MRLEELKALTKRYRMNVVTTISIDSKVEVKANTKAEAMTKAKLACNWDHNGNDPKEHDDVEFIKVKKNSRPAKTKVISMSDGV